MRSIGITSSGKRHKGVVRNELKKPRLWRIATRFLDYYSSMGRGGGGPFKQRTRRQTVSFSLRSNLSLRSRSPTNAQPTITPAPNHVTFHPRERERKETAQIGHARTGRFANICSRRNLARRERCVPGSHEFNIAPRRRRSSVIPWPKQGGGGEQEEGTRKADGRRPR